LEKLTKIAYKPTSIADYVTGLGKVDDTK